MNRDTLYSILGVPINSSTEDIHRNYRQFAKESHPDLKGKELHDKMVAINNAYRILKDPVTRDEYNFNELLTIKKLPVEVQEQLPSKLEPRKSRPFMQTVVKKITGKPTLYTMTAVAIRFRTAIMYASSPKPMHQEMAIEEFKKALEMEQKHADSLYNLGVLYCRFGEYSNGLYYFKKFLEIETDEIVEGIIPYIEQKAGATSAQYKTKKLRS